MIFMVIEVFVFISYNKLFFRSNFEDYFAVVIESLRGLVLEFF